MPHRWVPRSVSLVTLNSIKLTLKTNGAICPAHSCVQWEQDVRDEQIQCKRDPTQ